MHQTIAVTAEFIELCLHHTPLNPHVNIPECLAFSAGKLHDDQGLLRCLRQLRKTHVSVAVNAYALIAIFKKPLGLPQSQYTNLQAVSVTL